MADQTDEVNSHVHQGADAATTTTKGPPHSHDPETGTKHDAASSTSLVKEHRTTADSEHAVTATTADPHDGQHETTTDASSNTVTIDPTKSKVLHHTYTNYLTSNSSATGTPSGNSSATDGSISSHEGQICMSTLQLGGICVACILLTCIVFGLIFGGRRLWKKYRHGRGMRRREMRQSDSPVLYE